MSIPAGHVFPQYKDLRDAIHVPVILCTLAPQEFPYKPGELIEIYKENNIFFAKGTFNFKRNYIIDPFINASELAPGANVLVYIKPGTIDSVRHVWELEEIDKEIAPA